MLSEGIFLEHIYFFTDIKPLDAMFYAYIIKSLDVEKEIRDTPIVSELITIFFKVLKSDFDSDFLSFK